MKISCPNCSAAYELDDSRVPPAGLSIKCPKCKNPFTVHRPKGDAAAKSGGKGAVPLPGLADAVSAKAPPRASGGSGTGAGAVPLPGLEGGAPIAPPANAAGGRAVPLPGLDDGAPLQKTAVDFRPRPPASAPPPRPGSSAVPLPGLDESVPARGAQREESDPLSTLDPPAPVPSGAPQFGGDDPFAVTPKEESAPPRKSSTPKNGGTNFDFVDPPAPKPPSSSAADMLDFVDEQTAVAPKSGDKPGDKKKRPPPPTLGKSDAPASNNGEEADDREAVKEAKQKEKERKKQERERIKAEREPSALQAALRVALDHPARIAGVVVLLAVAAVAVLGVRAQKTPAGLFWTNRFLPSKRAVTAAQGKVIDKGLEKLGRGDFTGAREAVGAAAQLLVVLPDDDDVKAFFVLATSELKLEYGQVGGDWDQAKRVIEKMKASRPAQLRARGAFALANGDAAKGRQVLQPLGDNPAGELESVWLYANALVLSGEGVRAAQVLDNALKVRSGSTKLLLLRGEVARDKGQVAESAAFFERALVASPDNGRALIELAAARLKQGDAKAAGDFLAKALDGEVRKTLDAGEEARGNMLRGALLWTSHDGKGAEAAYERAISLDPNSPRIREAYGDFRLSRREWEKAARQFEASIATSAPTAAAHAGAAQAYLGLNRLLEADKEINLAVASDPSSAHYIYLQGRVAEVIGKSDEAFRKYEAALQKKPDLVEALAAEGVVYLNRSETPKAKEKLDAALKVPEAQLAAADHEAVGDLALLLGDRAGAKAAYLRALRKDPGDPIAHAGMGKALAAEGNLTGARKELEFALARVDSDASMYFEYGSLLRRMGESDAALEALRKAVKLDSKEARYRGRFGALLVERGQYDDAEQQLRQAVLMNDRYSEGLFYLARALAGRKNLAEASDTMKKAVEIDPDNSDYLYYLGLIYEMSQQVQNAVESFTRAIEKDPQNASAYEHLGLNLTVENRFGEAVSAFRKATAIAPHRARLWAELGDAEQQTGDVDGAIRDLQKALAQDQGLVGVWTKLGIAYKDKDCKGCRTKALDALRRAAQVDPADATAHHELGYMFKDDGRRKEAIAEFRRYLELRPDAGDDATVQDDIYYLQEESRRTP